MQYNHDMVLSWGGLTRGDFYNGKRFEDIEGIIEEQQFTPYQVTDSGAIRFNRSLHIGSSVFSGMSVYEGYDTHTFESSINRRAENLAIYELGDKTGILIDRDLIIDGDLYVGVSCENGYDISGFIAGKEGLIQDAGSAFTQLKNLVSTQNIYIRGSIYIGNPGNAIPYHVLSTGQLRITKPLYISKYLYHYGSLYAGYEQLDPTFPSNISPPIYPLTGDFTGVRIDLDIIVDGDVHVLNSIISEDGIDSTTINFTRNYKASLTDRGDHYLIGGTLVAAGNIFCTGSVYIGEDKVPYPNVKKYSPIYIGSLNLVGGSVKNRHLDLSDATQNIGIGTYMPNYLVDVQGSLGANEIFENGQLLSAKYALKGESGVIIKDIDSSNVISGVLSKDRLPLINSDKLQTVTGSGAVVLANSPTLSNVTFEGNIYANNSSLTVKNLSVIGDYTVVNTETQVTDQLIINNAGTGPALKVIQSGAQPVAEFIDSESGTALIIEDGGNVGIGTADPLYKLDVSGTVKATSFIGDGSQLTDINLANVTGLIPTSRLQSVTGTGVVALSTNPIFSGVLSANSISSTSLSGNGSAITNINPANITGTLSTAQVPFLDSSKNTSGTLGIDRIPTIGNAKISDVDASKVSTGTLGIDRIPSLSTDKLTSGIIPVQRGGTGAGTLSGYLYGNGTGAVTASATIPGGAISGSVSRSDTTNALSIYSSYGTNEIKAGTADYATFDQYNMAIRSWWGVGFPSYDNINRIVFDTRNGAISSKGNLALGNAGNNYKLNISNIGSIESRTIDVFDYTNVNYFTPNTSYNYLYSTYGENNPIYFYVGSIHFYMTFNAPFNSVIRNTSFYKANSSTGVYTLITSAADLSPLVIGVNTINEYRIVQPLQIQDRFGNQKVTVDNNFNVTLNQNYLGDIGYGYQYAAFCHREKASPGNYALLATNFGQTILNCSAGQTIEFRENNATNMVIASGGNVGVGTMTPQTKFQVSGTAQFGDSQLISGGFILGVRSAADNHIRLTRTAVNNQDMYINSNGDLIFKPGNAAKDVIFQNSLGTNKLIIDQDTGDVISSGTLTGDGLGLTNVLRTNSGERTFTFESPTASTVFHPILGTTSTYSKGLCYRVGNNPSVGDSLFQVRSSGQGIRFFVDHQGYLGSPMNSLYMNAEIATNYHILTGANVGIGTLTPQNALDVSGTIRCIGSTPRLIIQGTAGGGYASGIDIHPYYTANSPAGVTINALDDGAFGSHAQFLTKINNGTSALSPQVERMRILSNGNIGINTTAPTERLHVSGGNALINNTYLGVIGSYSLWAGFCHSSRNSDGNYAIMQNAAGNTLINSSTGQNIEFRHNNVTQVMVSGGNVGIGTATPTEKLHVNGNIKANGTLTVTNENITGILDFGFGKVGREVSAGKCGYNIFTGYALDIVGAGNSYGNRNVKIWDNVEVPGSVSVSNGVYVNAGGLDVVAGGVLIENGGLKVTGETELSTRPFVKHHPTVRFVKVLQLNFPSTLPSGLIGTLTGSTGSWDGAYPNYVLNSVYGVTVSAGVRSYSYRADYTNADEPQLVVSKWWDDMEIPNPSAILYVSVTADDDVELFINGQTQMRFTGNVTRTKLILVQRFIDFEVIVRNAPQTVLNLDITYKVVYSF